MDIPKIRQVIEAKSQLAIGLYRDNSTDCRHYCAIGALVEAANLTWPKEGQGIDSIGNRQAETELCNAYGLTDEQLLCLQKVNDNYGDWSYDSPKEAVLAELEDWELAS